jgi:hypothetical protein
MRSQHRLERMLAPADADMSDDGLGAAGGDGLAEEVVDRTLRQAGLRHATPRLEAQAREQRLAVASRRAGAAGGRARAAVAAPEDFDFLAPDQI